MILPTLVTQVLRNACGDLIDVQANPLRRADTPADTLPAIRVRPSGNPWAEGDRMAGRLVVVSFSQDGDPLTINPLALIDRATGDVLPEYMAGLPGVSMKLRTVAPSILRNTHPELPSYVAAYWSAAVTLGSAA
ncbi:hypothetical protein ACIBTZ_28535 [Micromonospora sp. NPDC049460]|uniref:hypothetical protein n=1 Tax=Micromonospora sp. NPDC049460 TaxID=3364272 RepID=UPI0037A20302